MPNNYKWGETNMQSNATHCHYYVRLFDYAIIIWAPLYVKHCNCNISPISARWGLPAPWGQHIHKRRKYNGLWFYAIYGAIVPHFHLSFNWNWKVSTCFFYYIFRQKRELSPTKMFFLLLLLQVSSTYLSMIKSTISW